MNAKIREVFKKLNIDCVGITDAAVYNAASGSDFLSVIAALFPYYCGYDDNSNLSIYTHGSDYHRVICRILNEAAQMLELGDFVVRSDIGPPIERTLAVNAGLCFIGRNGMCINEKYGSYFFIGYIACRERFEPDEPNTGSCALCMECVRACPGGALNNGFCAQKCLSAITQKKQPLTEHEDALIKEGKTAFGCDICQRVCPHNKNAKKSTLEEFVKNRITRLSLSEISAMSNREFMRRYSDRAFSWRGRRVLERNLRLITDSACRIDKKDV